MIIISWDVGVIHLAYCILEYKFDDINQKTTITILDWDEINLIEDDQIKLLCCGTMRVKKGESQKKCGKNAKYSLTTPKNTKIYGFCKTHLEQYNQYWSEKNTESLFIEDSSGHECNYMRMDGIKCNKNSKFYIKENKKNIYYCQTHYKSELKKKIKKYSPISFKHQTVNDYSTTELQLKLFLKLDELTEHFAKLGVEEVVIENQPSYKRPGMKSIASTLLNYFLVRGYIDKKDNMNIKLVRFICPSNKLKVNNNNTMEVFKANKNSKKKYKLTKALGIQYTKQLLQNDKKQLEYLDLYKKQDDICDAYLQGRYYLEFIKNKPTNNNNNKKYTGSKTNKKNINNKTNKNIVTL